MNENAKKMWSELKIGFKYSEVLRLNLQGYADANATTKRSAQRYLKEIREHVAISTKLHKGYQLISSNPALLSQTSVALSQNAVVLCDLVTYLGLIISDEKTDIMSPVSQKNDKTTAKNGKNDSGTPIYRPLQQLNALSWEDMGVPFYLDLILKEDLKNRLSFSEKNDKESVPAPSGTFGQLSSMVAHVCGINPMLLLEDDEFKIEKLFKIGADANDVYKRYSRDTKPNYWYSGHWKGRDKNARPTIVDVLKTWEMAKEFAPSAHDLWPPYKVIVADIEAVMDECGHRNVGKAMDKIKKLGYDEIIEKMGGGYVHMTRSPQKQVRINIANAIREIKQS